MAHRTLEKLKKPQKPLRRTGKASKTDKALVAQVVMDSAAEMTNGQILSLARVLRRTPDMIRTLVEQARESFVEGAPDYVRIHKQAVTDALALGDSKALQVAVQGSQWAIEKISAEGARIIDKDLGPSGSRIMVGIKIGGLNIEHPDVKVMTEE